MSKSRRAELLLVCTTVIWGSTFVVTKDALGGSSPILFVALRFLAASFILTLFFFKKLRLLRWEEAKKGVILGLLIYIGFVAQTIGLQYTTASKSAFFTGTLVVFTPIVQLVLERRLPRIGNLLGVIFAAVGLYLLTSPGGSEFNKGDALALLCAFLFAVYIVYLDTIPAEQDRFFLTYSQILTTGVLAIVCAIFFEDIRFAGTTSLVVSLLYLTIFATIITTWIQTRFQGDTQPTRAAVIFTLEPVLAAVIAYFVRGEALGTIGILGGAIIVTGLLLSELSDVIPGFNRTILFSDGG